MLGDYHGNSLFPANPNIGLGRDTYKCKIFPLCPFTLYCYGILFQLSAAFGGGRNEPQPQEKFFYSGDSYLRCTIHKLRPIRVNRVSVGKINVLCWWLIVSRQRLCQIKGVLCFNRLDGNDDPVGNLLPLLE